VGRVSVVRSGEHGDQGRREGGAQPEQRVQDQDGPVGMGGEERGGEGVQGRHGQPEAEPQQRGRGQQDRHGRRCALGLLAGQQQGHRERVGDQPTEEQEPGGQPSRQTGTGDGRGDRQHGLRQEQRAVLTGREPVVVRTGEDAAGRGERDERDALEQAGRVDRPDLDPVRHAAVRTGGRRGARRPGSRSRSR
jgi:ribonuclease E